MRLGTLTLHQDGPGPLSADEHADALVMAWVLVTAILARQARRAGGRAEVVARRLRIGR